MIKHGERLPVPFLRFWASDALTSTGDGFTLVAAPLLLVTLTSSPVVIAGGVFAAQIPWLLFGLRAGAIVDRTDRRKLIMAVDAVRTVLLAGLAVAVATGTATVALVYALLFASGTGDTLVMTAGISFVPSLVPRASMTRAYSRIVATRLIGASLLARPIGAWLFTRDASVPFVVDALSFLGGVLLLTRVPSPPPPPREDAADGADVRSGLRLLWRDRVLRVLAMCIFVMNVTLGATMAVLVIYAGERLGLGATGYGLLGAAIAAGGLVGTAVVNRLVSRFGPRVLLIVGLAVECGTQLTLALTTLAWVAVVTLVIFGVHSSVWSVLTVSLRQHRVADEVRGRVSSAYAVLSVSGAALGSLLGGVLVELAGITAPMWFGAVVVAAVFALAIPNLRQDEVQLETPAGVR
ncbi:MAG TPA: MFS transporter [Jatrophihabitans sp.]|jgi:predicted MFS family arabinose efflux permease